MASSIKYQRHHRGGGGITRGIAAYRGMASRRIIRRWRSISVARKRIASAHIISGIR